MFRMGIFSMHVVMRMIVVMAMIMVMTVFMMMVVMMIVQMQATLARAPRRAEITILNRCSGGRRTLSFNMMVVAFLNRPNLGFEPQNLGAILTQHTRRRRNIRKRGVAFTSRRSNCRA